MQRSILINRSELIKIHEGGIDHIDKIYDPGILNLEIYIYPLHVRNILLRFLDNELDADKLTKWAAFICIHPEYCVPDYMNDLDSDYYETMYYVIQRLSTPQLDGEITVDLVKIYLSELDIYFKAGH